MRMPAILLTLVCSAALPPVPAAAAADDGAAAAPAPLSPVPFPSVKVRDRFWGPRLETNRTVTIPHDFKMCEETGRISNFEVAGGLKPGEFRGIHYDDSDVYKVIEGAAYSLATHPDPRLDKYLDDLIAKIAAAQRPDGYLYTFNTVKFKDDPAKRYSNLKDGHELYCGGHMIEAAVAHYRATGKRSLLDVATKYANHLDRTFGAAPGKKRGVDGHEEIELALFKLADVTKNHNMAELAEFFVRERGSSAGGRTPFGRYYQDFKPVTQFDQVLGHAVRMAYLLCAMTDVAARTGDADFRSAVDRLWADLVGTKMYVTGGIGARHAGEAFGDAYELPNESAYAETCAAVGNALWNHRMNLLHADGKYADVVERVVYNGFLSGVSLGGDKFFYVNPLASRGSHHRQAWYDTACCPVNVVRFLPSLPGYVYATNDDGVFVNLYVQNEATVPVKGQSVRITQDTDYPWDGKIKLTVHPERPGPFSIFLRIPAWCDASTATLKVNGDRIKELPVHNGYSPVRVVWKDGDTVELDLPMPVKRVKADPKVKADEGRVALQRGPIVYCLEAVDNGGRVTNLSLPPDAELKTEHRDDLLGGVTVVKGRALARGEDETKPVEFTAIPYYAWDHRAPGEMAVWIPDDPKLAKPVPKPTPANTARASASHVNPTDTLDALSDGDAGSGPGDTWIPRFTWWDRKGTQEWVQYDLARPSKVSGVTVHWFDDTKAGGGCAPPKSWQVLYRDGDAWKPVKETGRGGGGGNVGNVGAAAGVAEVASFEPVETTALRLQVQLQPGKSGGILEWRVGQP